MSYACYRPVSIWRHEPNTKVTWFCPKIRYNVYHKLHSVIFKTVQCTCIDLSIRINKVKTENNDTYLQTPESGVLVSCNIVSYSSLNRKASDSMRARIKWAFEVSWLMPMILHVARSSLIGAWKKRGFLLKWCKIMSRF